MHVALLARLTSRKREQITLPNYHLPHYFQARTGTIRSHNGICSLRASTARIGSGRLHVGQLPAAGWRSYHLAGGWRPCMAHMPIASAHAKKQAFLIVSFLSDMGDDCKRN